MAAAPSREVPRAKKCRDMKIYSSPCIFAFIYMYMYIDMYVYIYIFAVYTYIYYIYIHVYVRPTMPGKRQKVGLRQPRKEGSHHKSSYVHIPTSWSLLYFGP